MFIRKILKRTPLLFVLILMPGLLASGCAGGDPEVPDALAGQIHASGESEIPGEIITALSAGEESYVVLLDGSGSITDFLKTEKTESSDIGRAVNPGLAAENADGVCYYYFERCEDVTNGGADSELVLLNEDLKEVGRIRYQPTGEGIEKSSSLAVDNHGALVFGKNSYILATAMREPVDNIPEEVNLYHYDSAKVEYIQEVENGKVKWTFSSKDHPEFYRYKMDKTSSFDHFAEDYSDYMHFNSMVVDPRDQNLLVSFRNQCSIVKLDRNTGEVLWILGGKGDEFQLDEESAFYCQHSISFTENGDLLMFDNRIEGENSRILELALDEKNKRAEVVRSIPLEADTVNWGSVQKVGKSTYLIDEGKTTDLDHQSGFYELDADTGEKTLEVLREDDAYSYWAAKRVEETPAEESSVPVPEGYAHTEGSVGSGYVISNRDGDEFVWIPSKKAFRYDFSKGKKLEDEVIDRIYYGEGRKESVLYGTEYEISDFIKSVEKYGGFYLSRYEIGDAQAAGPRSGEALGVPVSRAGASPYNFVTRDEALELSRSFYKGKDAVSTLASSYAWDMTMLFIGKDRWKDPGPAGNIHDLAGGLTEWTTEYSSNAYYDYHDDCVSRGGAEDGAGPNAAARHYNSNARNEYTGFRIVLYMK